jgi:hypothetical protein
MLLMEIIEYKNIYWIEDKDFYAGFYSNQIGFKSHR